MDGYLNVVQKRADSLIQITIKERKEHGLGCLFLDFSKENNMDCGYVSLSNGNFPEHLQQYTERMKSVPNSIIFFYIYDGKEDRMLEIDLDKNSNFYNQSDPSEQSN